MGGERKRYKPSPRSERGAERDTSSQNLLCALRDSQTSSSQRRLLVHTLRDVLSSKLLPPMLESQPKRANLRNIDKCFACAWVSDQYVVVGTKCNKLLCVDAASMRMCKIPLPPKPARPQALSATSSSQPGCGIHTVALSPDGSMLAVGGAAPTDCQIFHIQHQTGAYPTFTPTQCLVGHQDWLFGVTWLTDRHIVTASRDHTVKLWCTDDPDGNTVYKPLETRLDHKTKVRDVKYCRETLKLATLGTDGILKLWDPNLTLLQSVQLPQTREVVCMSITQDLLAVGSQSHVTLLDPRMSQPTIKIVNSVDPGQGVRSLGIMDNILSSGSGRGRIAFFDLRASAYISVQQEALSRPQTPIPTQIYDNEDFYDDSIDDYDDEYADPDDFHDLDEGLDDVAEVDEVADVTESAAVNDVGVGDEADEEDFDEEAEVEDDVEAEGEADGSNSPLPRWYRPERDGLPDFRRHIAGPTTASSALYHPQPQALNFGLTAQSNLWLQTGHGWLDQNHVYLDHFRGMEIWNACYAHVWDPTKTKLFSTGGPLAFGLVGSYMGVWN